MIEVSEVKPRSYWTACVLQLLIFFTLQLLANVIERHILIDLSGRATWAGYFGAAQQQSYTMLALTILLPWIDRFVPAVLSLIPIHLLFSGIDTKRIARIAAGIQLISSALEFFLANGPGVSLHPADDGNFAALSLCRVVAACGGLFYASWYLQKLVAEPKLRSDIFVLSEQPPLLIGIWSIPIIVWLLWTRIIFVNPAALIILPLLLAILVPPGVWVIGLLVSTWAASSFIKIFERAGRFPSERLRTSTATTAIVCGTIFLAVLSANITVSIKEIVSESGPFKTKLEARYATSEQIVNKIAWSPDGTSIAISEGLNNKITIWDYRKNRRVKEIPRAGLALLDHIAFKADGSALFSTVLFPTIDNHVAVSMIDVASGQINKEVPGPVEAPISPKDNAAQTLAVSHSMDILAFSNREDVHKVINHLTLFDLDNWVPILSENEPDTIASLVFCPNTNYLAVLFWNGELQLREPSTGKVLDKIQTGTSRNLVSCSANGQSLVTAGAIHTIKSLGANPLHLKTWTVPDLQLKAEAVLEKSDCLRLGGISLNPSKDLLASITCDSKIRLWDPTTLKVLQVVEDGGRGARDIAFSPDGSKLAVARDAEVTVIGVEPRAKH